MSLSSTPTFLPDFNSFYQKLTWYDEKYIIVTAPFSTGMIIIVT